MFGTNLLKLIKVLFMAQHIINFHKYSLCTKDECVFWNLGMQCSQLVLKYSLCYLNFIYSYSILTVLSIIENLMFKYPTVMINCQDPI